MKDGKIITSGTTEELLNIVKHKVWICNVSAKEALPLQNKLKVVNLRNTDDARVELRYLSDVPETADSVPADPHLEDLYLWLSPRKGDLKMSSFSWFYHAGKRKAFFTYA